MPVGKIPRFWAKEFASLKADLDALATLTNDLKAKYNAAVTLINELKTDMSEHTHTENIAGSYTQNAETAAGLAIAAADAAVTAVADVSVGTK